MPETTRQYTKRSLLTGAGNLYLQMMETLDTPSAAPVYDNTVYETPSLDTLATTLEIAEKEIYLSNKLHDSIVTVKFATVTVDAGYFPEGFAEEAQGMINVGGGWSMPSNPVKKPFRMGVPFTDTNGDELILNFPKCLLNPSDLNGETQRDDINEQLKQFVIKAVIPEFKGDMDKELVYHKMDMAVEENKTKYDRDKLLNLGWYDNATAKLCEKLGE